MKNLRYQSYKFFEKAKNQAKIPKKPSFIHTYCIYHDKDIDGVLSAALIKQQYPDVIFIPFDYGYELDLKNIKKDSGVFMVDCSLPEDQMKYLNDRVTLYLFDHHYRTCSEKMFKNYKGVRMMNIATCMLVYEYFNSFSTFPEGIKLAGYYDINNREDLKYWDLEIIPFQFGLYQFPLDPSLEIYQQVIESKPEIIEAIISDGKVIQRYCKEEAKKMMNKYGYTTSIVCNNEEYCVLVLNKQFTSLDYFRSKLNKNIHDFCIAYQEKEGIYHYSLRSWPGSVNVHDIAKYFNSKSGGGHKYAAGFFSEKNIFEIQKS